MISVSVIVPVYNKVQYLSRSVDSILRQSMQNVEILLIDDQSTDGSYELCQRLYGALPQVRLLRNAANKGAGRTRNVGMEAAKGRYIAFVDADDIIHQDYLKRMYQEALRRQADIVVECGSRITQPEVMETELAKRAERLLDSSYMTAIYQKLFSRDFLLREHIRFHEHVFFEDVLFSLEGLLVAKNIIMMPDVLYEIIETPESITRGKNLVAKAPAYADSIVRAMRNLSGYMEKIPELQNDRTVRNMFLVYLLRLSMLAHFSPLLKEHSLEEVNGYIEPVMRKEFGDNYQYVMLLLDWCMKENC